MDSIKGRRRTIHLVVDSMKFHSTWRPENRDEALQVAERCGLVMREYGVHIHSAIDGKVNWDKVDGCSLWEGEWNAR